MRRGIISIENIALKQKKDVVWFPKKELSTRDQNNTENATYISIYGL